MTFIASNLCSTLGGMPFIAKLLKIKKKKEGEKMETINEGLFLKGTVTGRSKRYVGENNKELVTYQVLSNAKDVYLKQWEPKDNYFSVGEVIDAPVFVKGYEREGRVYTDIVLRNDDFVMKGENF
jgi:hypothetical protein